MRCIGLISFRVRFSEVRDDESAKHVSRGVGRGELFDARRVAQMTPPEATKEHKLLQQDVGVWDADMKIWMQGPDSDPVVSQGVERSRPLGDLWVLSTFEGAVGEQKSTGHSQMGYDPLKKKRQD